MSLIVQIRDAVNNGDIQEPFTTEHLQRWMTKNKIVKDDGCIYKESSIRAILSNSDLKNIKTTNGNIKLLRSRENTNKRREYWFAQL